MNKKNLILKLFVIMLILGIAGSACLPDNNFNYADDSYTSEDDYVVTAEDCYPNETYDPVEHVCYIEDDEAAWDEDWEGDEADDYWMTAEDCYPDETYDPVEHVCYIEIECETDAECEEYSSGLLDMLWGLFEDDTVYTDDFDNNNENYAEGEDAEINLVTYTIQGDEITSPEYETVIDDLVTAQKDTSKHKEMWVYFARLIPSENRAILTQFVIFTDGVEGTMASVSQDENDAYHWILAVDIADTDEKNEFTYTLIHEFGHLLTLNPDQVPPSVALFNQPDDDSLYASEAASCSQYFTGEGCSNPDSYINAFFDRFWVDLYEEFLDVDTIEDEDEYYAALDNFYADYKSYFVTDYAATNPAEDIAESWTAFVLKPKPAGNTIADQKVLFFYEYPELVNLRTVIISETYARLRRIEN